NPRRTEQTSPCRTWISGKNSESGQQEVERGILGWPVGTKLKNQGVGKSHLLQRRRTPKKKSAVLCHAISAKLHYGLPPASPYARASPVSTGSEVPRIWGRGGAQRCGRVRG